MRNQETSGSLDAEAGAQFGELVRILRKLRAPGGCPWDRAQTLQSIKPYVLEEAYEVLDAIDSEDWPGLADELGDLLLQPVFIAAIAEAEGHFPITACLDSINRKLIRRHPHVFAGAIALTPDEVKRTWNEVKAREKEHEKRKDGAGPAPLLVGIPRNLPALVEAQKVTGRASAMGFDWPDIEGVLQKVQEEADELAAAHTEGKHLETEKELGDLLFTVVNLARFLAVDPEQALRGSISRFRKRFGVVEQALADEGATFTESTPEHLEELWQTAKRAEG